MVLIFEYKQILIEGAFVTIMLAIVSLLLSVFFGLLGAFAKLSASSVARRTGNVYTTFVRSVPDLVLMMLIFLGGRRWSISWALPPGFGDMSKSTNS
jgi:histidine transport system permease protein/arginine/ornithine transport system permease protein